MDTLQNNKTTYNGIDFMKFIMALFVVGIHSAVADSLPHPFSEICGCVFELAVPFFFIASGFFVFKKLNGDYSNLSTVLARIKECTIRYLKLYLIWTAIYLPLTIIGMIKDGDSVAVTVVRFLRNILLVGENYFSWALWYLLALVTAMLIMYVLFKVKMSRRGILILGGMEEYCMFAE